MNEKSYDQLIQPVFNDWALFEPNRMKPVNKRYTGTDKIYVVPYGSIVISRELYQLIDRVGFVQFKSNGRYWGLVPCDREAPGSYRVDPGPANRNNSPRIVCKEFLREAHLMVENYIVAYPIQVWDTSIVIKVGIKPEIIREFRPHKTKKKVVSR